MIITSAADIAAENAANAQLVATVWADIRYIARRLQPDADVFDTRHAGQVWAGLQRAWVAAGEPGTFQQFVDEALATVGKEAA